MDFRFQGKSGHATRCSRLLSLREVSGRGRPNLTEDPAAQAVDGFSYLPTPKSRIDLADDLLAERFNRF
jgi:hypothetical protein